MQSIHPPPYTPSPVHKLRSDAKQHRAAFPQRKPVVRLGHGASIMWIVQATRGALLRRERLMASGHYFVHDLRYSRDLAVPLALSRLAAEGLTPALTSHGSFDPSQLRAIIQLYRALAHEQLRDAARLPASNDAWLPVRDLRDVSHCRPLQARRVAPPPPPPKLFTPRPRRADVPPMHPAPPRPRPTMPAPAPRHPRVAPANSSSSISWRALPMPARDPSIWASIMTSGAAALVTAILMHTAWKLML